MDKKIDVIYSCDNNYVLLLAVSVKSLIDNNTNIEGITIHLLSIGISDGNKKKLTEIVNRGGGEV